MLHSPVCGGHRGPPIAETALLRYSTERGGQSSESNSLMNGDPDRQQEPHVHPNHLTRQCRNEGFHLSGLAGRTPLYSSLYLGVKSPPYCDSCWTLISFDTTEMRGFILVDLPDAPPSPHSRGCKYTGRTERDKAYDQRYGG